MPVIFENEWMSFFAELRRFRHEVGGRIPYLPSPSDIVSRTEDLRWLEEQGFCRKVIVNVMELDTPYIDRFRQMVKRHGPREACLRCFEFFEQTEYDTEVRSCNDCHSG